MESIMREIYYHPIKRAILFLILFDTFGDVKVFRVEAFWTTRDDDDDDDDDDNTTARAMTM